MTLHFEPDTHTYTLGERRLPSVTEVLEPLIDYSRVPRDVLEAARVFGSHVHKACDLFNRDELDWSSLDDALVPYVSAWKQFLDDTGAVVIASETPVYHDRLGYAGTPDVVLAWDSRVVIPDLKSTAVVPPTVGPQTSGYAKAYQHMHGGREPERRCIQLNANGTYRVHRTREPSDWSYFISALNCYKFREKYNAA